MLNDLIVLFNNVLNSAYGSLKANVATPLFYTLIIIDITIFGLMIAIQADTSPQEILKKLLTIAGLIFLFRNFSTIANLLYSSFAALGTYIPTNTTYTYKWQNSNISLVIDHNVGPYIEQPGKILEEMNKQLMQPLWDYMSNATVDGPMGVKLPDFKVVVVCGLALLTVIVSFVLIVIQMVLIRIEFGIILCAGIVVFPFSAFQFTRFIGAKVWPALISVSIKIGIVSILTAILIKIVQSLVTPAFGTDGISFAYLIGIIVTCALFLYLFLQVPQIANTILNGVSSMSAGGFLQNTAAALHALKDLKQLVTGGSKTKTNSNEGTGGKIENYLMGGGGGNETSRGTPPPPKNQSEKSPSEAIPNNSKTPTENSMTQNQAANETKR